ncbi:cobyric acid synthase [Thiomicrospira sp. R3]|uniref:cobyric acid synthase n=1 Tax=Thiomicrospira sp. R3 TaxID=3035472 RepID=UPI00259B2E83|nr:cobyric acid synthase [Thiomicrospira sp. R3]WFE68197.1 cobyric acid synthase [Thiomicrospira sp. R3]
MPHTLMIQGCTSDAGKSTLVAGLCRVLVRRGFKVAPFKPQNMALNSAVTAEGGEIGRAQALQAQAAHIAPTVHMNPVLLKPNSDTGAQVILQGQSIGNLNALDYQAYKPKAAQAVFDSFHILSTQYPLIVVEGAGSPAEINLRQGDIANMGFAEAIDCPVILIADIDKGGVFAHIVGTLACLSESERNRIKGFVINRFRGDIALLQDGLDWLEQQTGKPVLGVLPYLHGLHLDAEDAVASNHPDTNTPTKTAKLTAKLKVVCPLLPHISNHTDLDPLTHHPQVNFQWVKHNEPIPPADLVILPGSKNVAFDLNFLNQQDWLPYLQKHLRYGGKLIGICGGLQMLGQRIEDPDQIESDQTELPGLALMNYTTRFYPQKQLINRSGLLQLPGLVSPVKIAGYEIHQGITDFSHYTPTIQWHNNDMGDNDDMSDTDGAISQDNQIFVTYCHGLFDQPETLTALLNWAGLVNAETFDLNQQREQQLNRLADTLDAHLDMDKILDLLHS